MEQKYTIEFIIKGTIVIEAISNEEARAKARMYLRDLIPIEDGIVAFSPDIVELGDSCGEDGTSGYYGTPPSLRK